MGSQKALRLLLLPLALLFLSAARPGLCQPPGDGSAPAVSLSELSRSIDQTVVIEEGNLKRYKSQLETLRNMKISLAAAANAYQIQLSTYGNLLLSPNAEVEALDRAWTELRTSLARLEAQIEELMPGKDRISVELGNTQKQQELIERQIAELEKLPGKSEAARELKDRAGTLAKLLAEKRQLLQQLKELYESRLSYLRQTRQSFIGLLARFESQVEERKTLSLFERRKSPLSREAWDRLLQEARLLAAKTTAMVRPQFWTAEARELWAGAGLLLISLGVLVVVLLALLVRLRRGLLPLEAHPVRERLGLWHLVALRLVNGSLYLTGITVFVYLCSLLDALYLSSPSIRLLAHLLTAALLTRWFSLFLLFWERQRRLSAGAGGRLRRLVAAVRYFAWSYLLLGWALGRSSGLLLIARLAFELWLIAWQASFWGFLERREKTEEIAANLRRLRYLIPAGKTLGYLIVGGALLMDMIGYGGLSLYWLVSWAKSLVVALWWGAAFFLFREWDYYYREKSASERDELLHDEYPIQWLAIRFGQLLWLISALVALILAWGGRQIVLARIYQGLGHSVKIGSMSFSMLGLVGAVLVLLATQAVVRLWRWIFQTKFLTRSGMEVGLQDSITTISVYFIWMLGILVALHVFGLNTASLAVAFGALGIGLGFGLQNIFNNFVSGIILLFERPIQVGDDVEINGTWATVKKINVRSTVVQTFDNASLIIPNSDFVSSQVTNWSFKDKRLRRNIVVGVAYGSNVTLVKDTLLEVAEKTPRVLKHPAPDVLFTDFGDSALIFRLRIWTDIDNMLKVETAIRFEIDRLFRQRGIEISFPQRDIHIRSWLPAAEAALEKEKEA